MSKHTLDALGAIYGFVMCGGLSLLHFQTYRDPERNAVTRFIYRYWERMVAIKTFGWRPFEEPEPAIRFQSWFLFVLALFLLAVGGASFFEAP